MLNIIFEDKLTLCLGLLFLLVSYWFLISDRKENQPPGPWLKVPIFGSAPFICKFIGGYEVPTCGDSAFLRLMISLRVGIAPDSASIFSDFNL